MNKSHVAGGGLGAVLASVIVGILHRYGITLSDTDAALIGSAALGFGVGLGHGLSAFGIKGLVKAVWAGFPKPTP